MTAGLPSYGRRLHELANAAPDEIAIIFAGLEQADRDITWAELDVRSTQIARVLASEGLGVDDRLAIKLRNSPDHVFAAFAGWKLGALVVPIRWDLPAWELDRVQKALHATVTVDDGCAEPFAESVDLSAEPLPDVTPPRARGMCSSGSTGTPKIIVIERPGLVDPKSISVTAAIIDSYERQAHPQRVLVPGPLYHTNGFAAMNHLLIGDSIVLLERFDPRRVLDLIESRGVNGFTAATVLLQRIAKVAGIEHRDLTSLCWVQQGAALLPHWLAHRWIDLLGPERFFMSYGMTEGLGLCAIRGDEWLDHPGSVGRPWGTTDIRIVDEAGHEIPTGEVGEIYMRSLSGTSFSYLGDAPPPAVTEDGYATVGDLGWVDEDGYLFIADRRSDMIITGGANVYPAEVEAALSEHPKIADVVVLGLADPEWGRRVHALVVAADPQDPITSDEVVRFARSRLAPYKVPKTVELTQSIPRSEATKINRSALVDERDAAAEANAKANEDRTTS